MGNKTHSTEPSHPIDFAYRRHLETNNNHHHLLVPDDRASCWFCLRSPIDPTMVPLCMINPMCLEPSIYSNF